MTPRNATAADIPELVEMGRQFHAMSPHKWLGDYDAGAVTNMLAYLIGSPDAIVVTNGVGCVGGIIAPVYFDPTKRMLEESFWWAEKGGRDLLRAFEAIGRQKGAQFLYLSTLENERTAVIDRVVKAAGYLPVERRYVKELRS